MVGTSHRLQSDAAATQRFDTASLRPARVNGFLRHAHRPAPGSGCGRRVWATSARLGRPELRLHGAAPCDVADLSSSTAILLHLHLTIAAPVRLTRLTRERCRRRISTATASGKKEVDRGRVRGEPPLSLDLPRCQDCDADLTRRPVFVLPSTSRSRCSTTHAFSTTLDDTPGLASSSTKDAARLLRRLCGYRNGRMAEGARWEPLTVQRVRLVGGEACEGAGTPRCASSLDVTGSLGSSRPCMC